MQISKHPQHDHFWIENEMLYESYKTSRGLRHHEVCEMPGHPNSDSIRPAVVILIDDMEAMLGAADDHLEWIKNDKFLKRNNGVQKKL